MEPGVSAPKTIVVIGAGPAGAMAAYSLAQRGCDVLLVDKATFPRDKVCGCCINKRALATLEQAGLTPAIGKLNGCRLDRLVVSAGGEPVTLALPPGLSLSRSRFDGALVSAAVTAGAKFIDGASAKVVGHDEHVVIVTVGGESIEAGLVLVADGLGGRSLDHLPDFRVQTRAASRMGAALILDPCDAPAAPAGAIRMMCSHAGYVGMVRLEDSRVNLAAAFDAERVRALGGPGPAAGTVLVSNGIEPTPAVCESRWRGTPALTRRRRVAGTRIFVIGDAAGYVEPFTGEGIAWSLCCGQAVVDVAIEAAQEWRPRLIGEWARRHREVVGRRQYVCRAAAAVLRRPGLTRVMLGALRAAPWLAGPVMRHITRPAGYTSAPIGG